MWSDLRFACRSWTATPAEASLAVFIVAVALSAVLAMAGLLDALVFRPMAGVRDPRALVAVSFIGTSGRRTNISQPALSQVLARQRALEAGCGFSIGAVFPVERDGTVTLHAATLVENGCMRLIGVLPAIGSLAALDRDTAAGPNPIVALGYGFWQHEFGGDRSIVGRQIVIQGQKIEVVGVAAPSFAGFGTEVDADLLLPVNYNPTTVVDAKHPYGTNFLLGRLRPGATLDGSRAEVVALWPGVRDETTPAGATAAQITEARALRPTVESFATGFSNLRERYAAPLRALTAIACALLAIACVSVGGLLLARSLGRQQELATRLTLGASGAMVLRQIVVDAALPILAGAAVAIPLSWWSRVLIRNFIWTGISVPTLDVSPTWAEAGAVLVLALLAAIIAGLAVGSAVLRSARRLRVATRSVGQATHRWGGLLLVAQVALSLALVFAAGLLVRSASRLEGVPLGFAPEHVLEARLLPSTNGYVGLDAPTYYRALATTLGALPGVTSVAYSHVFPAPIVVAETASLAASSRETAGVPVAFETVSPHFFDTIGATLVAGREFAADDGPASVPVAIVSRNLAARLFPSGHALGQHLRLGKDPHRSDLEIVGVVGDVRLGDVRKDPIAAVYRPLEQEPAIMKQPIVLVRASGDPRALVEPLRRVLAKMGREYTGQPLALSTQIGNTILQERTMALLATVFAAVVLLLSLVGLYGLFAQRVRRRVPELGVRLSLGATPMRIRRMIVGEALRLVLVGVVLGVPLALLLAQLARSVLFDLSPTDPLTLVAAATLFGALGVAGVLAPARRAAAVDPAQSMRSLV